MANLFQGITSGFAELKNFYQGPIIDAINEDVPIYRACEKVKEGWSGFQVVRAIRTVRNQGVGATSDGGVLPQISRQGVVQATISAKFNYLRFGLTGPMIKSSQSDIGSFVRSAGYELEQGYLDLKTEVSRQLSWTGRGDLATMASAAVASTSLSIQGRTTAEPALKYLDVGSQFDIIDTNFNIIQAGITVVSFTVTTPASNTATLVVNQPVTASANNILIRSGSNQNEIQGLFYALDGGTTTVYGVNRSTALAYQGNVTDVSTTTNPILSIDAMQTPYNEGLRRGNVNMYNANFCDFTGLRYYQKLLTPDKRYANTVEGDGTFGKKGQFYMDFNGVPMVPDKDMSLKMAFLPAQVLKMYELAAMEFADETGSMYIAQTDVDQFEVRIRHFTNLFNEQPAACGVLQGFVSP
jgi:hypothetical protein